MAKSILSLLLIIGCFGSASAKHITGGEMTYTYQGAGTLDNSKLYRITLWLFRDENCTGCADMPTSVSIGVFDNSSGTLVGGYHTVNLSTSLSLPLNPLPECITNAPNLNYRGASYTFLVSLVNIPQGYTATYQTCCRIDGIMNVGNSVGATYIAQIPGTNTIFGGNDSSPQFSKGISVVCYNKPFTLDFSAVDNDPGDVLVYSLCGAYDGGGATNANFTSPAPPPYNVLGYTNGYTGSQPLGPYASINSATGIISGIAPEAGRYVVSVCIDIYKSGNLKAKHRKDFIITVAPCDFAGAQLQPSYINCDGFTFNFENLNNSPLNNTFFWDFGDGNTSTLANPVHTYTTAGVYAVKLVVNSGGSCSDSTTSSLGVFPGYFPGFTSNAPMCKGNPVSFRDATVATYGLLNSWQWNFGDGSSSSNASILQNPTHTFNTAGTYIVSLQVTSDKGCTGTFTDTLTIVDKPVFSLTNDTLICSIDTLQLNAVTSVPGTIVWSPNYNISNVNSFSPQVWPKTTTTYTANYADTYGCSGSKQVTVNVVDSVTLKAMQDTSICTTDQVRLSVASNALHYNWSPAESLDNPNIKNPLALPVSNTLYSVVGRIGKCSTTDNVLVKTVPYPVVTVNADTTICFGNNVLLQASGGSIYTWTPRVFLSSTNVPNPTVIKPSTSIRYIVTVRDTLGCPKPVSKPVTITVVKIIANAGPSDTSVVLGQPLQLYATGSTFYQWTPGLWLSNTAIQNPVSLPQDNILYTVRVSDSAGCFSSDTINVKLYTIEPDILVPSGFTPDGDGLNDIFRPIAVGMKTITAFRVYNRWGQLLFSTTIQNAGWDGTFKGNKQDGGTYVWYAEGVTYLNKKIQRRGYVVLIK